MMEGRIIESRDHMKERLTIRKRGQVTLPKSILERFDLAEGDTLELSVDEHTGEMTVIPMIQVPPASVVLDRRMAESRT